MNIILFLFLHHTQLALVLCSLLTAAVMRDQTTDSLG